MKQQIKLIGIDDSPFKFQDKDSTIIGTIMRADGYLEGVLKQKVSVKKLDATKVCIEMINNTRHKSQLKAIMIDGCAVAGFNIVDIFELNKNTNIPVITVTRDKPDFESIKKALKKHFKDWGKRWDILSKNEIYKVETRYNPVFITFSGLDFSQAKEIIKISTIRGVIPEPIRVAHLVASGITRGESYGKA